MPFVPYRELRLQSALTMADAVGALRAQVAPPRPLLSFGVALSGELFEGTVCEDGFELQRVIQYRNSFLPQIRGGIAPTPSGCTITMTMSLHPLVLAFALFWLTGVSAAAVVLFTSAVQSSAWRPETFIPLAMLFIFWLVATLGFRFEARKAEELLREILDAVPG